MRDVGEVSTAVAVGETVASPASPTDEVVATTVSLGGLVATGEAAAVTVTKIVSKRVTVAMSPSDETVLVGSDAVMEVDGDEDPSIGGDANETTTVGEVAGGTIVEDDGATSTGDEVGETRRADEVGVAIC